MRMHKLAIGAAAASAALFGAQAHADDLRGFIRFGVTQITPNANSVDLSVAGVEVPDAAFDASSESGAVAEAGVYLYGNWALALSLTSSVLTENVGGGSLAATPNLGSDSFMLASLTGQYHFDVTDRFRPFLGAGLGYFHPTGAYDGIVTNLSVDSSFGSVLQAGLDYDLTDRWGAFLDVKQYFIGIKATGLLAGMPVEAAADLDPLVVNSGLTFRF